MFLSLMGPCIRPVRFTTDTSSLQALRVTECQDFFRTSGIFSCFPGPKSEFLGCPRAEVMTDEQMKAASDEYLQVGGDV
jgi:hypothetical protein